MSPNNEKDMRSKRETNSSLNAFCALLRMVSMERKKSQRTKYARISPINLCRGGTPRGQWTSQKGKMHLQNETIKKKRKSQGKKEGPEIRIEGGGIGKSQQKTHKGKQEQYEGETDRENEQMIAVETQKHGKKERIGRRKIGAKCDKKPLGLRPTEQGI